MDLEAVPISYPTERTVLDPPRELGKYREESPMRLLQYPDGEVGWLVTSHALVRQALEDPRLSSAQFVRVVGDSFPPPSDPAALSRELTEIMGPSRKGTFLSMDPPEHTRFRRALGGRFSAKYVARLGETIESIVSERIELMTTSPRPFDLVSNFALPVALGTICEVLGIPVRPEWNSILELMEVNPPLDPELVGAYRQFRDAMAVCVDELLENANDGVLSYLIHDVGLSREEVIGVGQFLVVAGHHTTTNMMAVGTCVLLQDRRNWNSIVTTPERFGPMLEELIRYVTVLQLAPFTRIATEAFDLGGVSVLKGQRVQVSAPAANRDPSYFANPDKFEPDRDAAGHVAFGHGIHQCLGQHLARLELTIVFRALATRFPDLALSTALEDLVVFPGSYPGHGIATLPVTWGAETEGGA